VSHKTNIADPLKLKPIIADRNNTFIHCYNSHQSLPPIMRKRFISLSHAMRVFPLLDRTTRPVCRIH
jgi:hypothetical protein